MAQSFFESTPAEFVTGQDPSLAHRIDETEEQRQKRAFDEKVREYVIAWRNQLRMYRYEKLGVWNECWQLYRGQEDWSDKEDWQSKIVLPKSFSSVKQATNVIKRLLSASKKPWQIESENPNDQVNNIRTEQMTYLSRVFMEKANFLYEFSEALECSFIMGCGIVKLWWGLVPRIITKVETRMVPLGLAGVTTANPNQQYVNAPADPNSYSPTGSIPNDRISDNANIGPNHPPDSTDSRGGPTPPGVDVSRRGVGTGPIAGTPAAGLGGGGQANQPPPEQQPGGAGVPVEPPASTRTQQPLGQLPKALQQQDARTYPTMLGNEFISPMNLPGGQSGGGLGVPSLPGQPPTLQAQKQLVREETLEGRLFLRSVDPYNFYWLPGSKMNRWTGTIEEIELPKWELMQMAQEGVFDPELVKQIQPMKIEEQTKQSWLRFGEMPRTTNGPTADTGVIKLTEYYGPIVLDGEVKERWGHVLIANDTIVLINGKNQFWHRKPPYIGFSPVVLPFRTEGVGLVENVRQIDKALNRLANMSVDTLMFRLMPFFEITTDAFENPEDFDTGLTPGKLFRRNAQYPTLEGIKPIETLDIGPGATQLSSELNVAHQEGSLISQLQQSIPRYRGSQTATETQLMQDNQQSFFGSMASDIESQFIDPMIMMAIDLIMQFIDTANDPRVASILGLEAATLAGMTREEIMEMIQGDYKVRVTGVTGQLEKAEMLQNLVQFMNLIGQNPQAWLPYINQNKLLQRILEAFRPAIHDVEEIIADPETVQANQQAMLGQEITPDLLNLIPQLVRLNNERQSRQFDQAQLNAEHAAAIHQQNHEHTIDNINTALGIASHHLAVKTAEQTPQSAGVSSSPTQSGQGN
jgi:hypothetical protein